MPSEYLTRIILFILIAILWSHFLCSEEKKKKKAEIIECPFLRVAGVGSMSGPMSLDNALNISESIKQ